MLGITVSRVAEAALDYFDRELTGKQEAGYYGTGVWRGKLAERLELRGEERREDFQALLRNEKPQGGRLTARKNTTRSQDGKRAPRCKRLLLTYVEESAGLWAIAKASRLPALQASTNLVPFWVNRTV